MLWPDGVLQHDVDCKLLLIPVCSFIYPLRLSVRLHVLSLLSVACLWLVCVSEL